MPRVSDQDRLIWAPLLITAKDPKAAPNVEGEADQALTTAPPDRIRRDE